MLKDGIKSNRSEAREGMHPFICYVFHVRHEDRLTAGWTVIVIVVIGLCWNTLWFYSQSQRCGNVIEADRIKAQYLEQRGWAIFFEAVWSDTVLS